jgi:hypothetical protein
MMVLLSADRASRARVVDRKPLCPRGHNLSGLGWLEADFGDADFDNMSVIAVVKRAARRKESLPGEIPSGGVYVLVFPRTSGMLVQGFQCPGTRE